MPEGTAIKVVEVPPGPPVLATLLAEVYGPDAEARREAARTVRSAFEAVPFVVDVDDSFGRPADRIRFSIDQENLEFHGVEQEAVYDTLAAIVHGVPVGYSHRGEGTDPIEDRDPPAAGGALPLRAAAGDPRCRPRPARWNSATWSGSGASRPASRSSGATASRRKW